VKSFGLLLLLLLLLWLLSWLRYALKVSVENAGLQTAIQYDPAGTPMGTYCSFVDTFEVSGSASGDCYFLLTGGTSDGSTWAGTANVSIILIRLF